MRREFVVISVAASPDRRSDVVVSLLEEGFTVPERASPGLRGPAHPIFSSPHYIQSECSTRFFMNFPEYQSSALKVGDRVVLSISKVRRRRDSETARERAAGPDESGSERTLPG
jgi:hypothetical protein